MGKRSAVVELFLGDMGSIQRELRPSTQREDQLTMETKLEQIAVKAVNQLPKSVVREIRTPRSVGAGGGRPPPATRWARGNSRPYREPGPTTDMARVRKMEKLIFGSVSLAALIAGAVMAADMVTKRLIKCHPDAPILAPNHGTSILHFVCCQ